MVLAGVEAPLAVLEDVILPVVSDVLALAQIACTPPEEYTKIPAAIKVSNAVSRQYSAKSCPLSSFRKRLRNARNCM